jgi:outer membrane protein assembly factor BamB
MDGAKLWSLALWPAVDAKKAHTTGLVLAGGLVLASGESEVAMFEAKADGKELGRVTVPGRISHNSLAVADERVFVVTEEGGVYCLTGNEAKGRSPSRGVSGSCAWNGEGDTTAGTNRYLAGYAFAGLRGLL